METNVVDQSQKTSERIEVIKSGIRSYRKSIKRLRAYAEGRRRIDRSPYAPRIIKYNCIPISEKQFIWTLENIKTQILILERELQTLIKYSVKEDVA